MSASEDLAGVVVGAEVWLVGAAEGMFAEVGTGDGGIALSLGFGTEAVDGVLGGATVGVGANAGAICGVTAAGVAGGICGPVAAVNTLGSVGTGGTEVVGGTGVGAGGCGADIQGLF